MGDTSIAAPGDPDRHFAPPPPPTTHHRHARSTPFALPAKNVPTQHSTIKTQHSLVVVGVCSAGKSTLVSRLRELGYGAQAVAQEHSGVPYLWQRTKPDVLIYLDASIHTIHRRRHNKWKQSRLDEERARLQHAREHCDLYIPTDGLSPDDVASRVVTFLNNRKEAASG